MPQMSVLGSDANYLLFLLILTRMSGCILFNPILGRNEIPFPVKSGIAVILSVFTYQILPRQDPMIGSFLALVLAGCRELLIGFMAGFIIQLFLSVFVMSGEAMDMQIGISMSKVYDPSSNISMPLSASVINAMFILMFFATNSHLTLIQVFVRLCSVIPYGDRMIPPDAFKNLAGLFTLMLIYAVKLALPILAVQLISEFGVGLITRAVPQVDIFSMQIQLKLIIGFLAMMILVPSFSDFLQRLMVLMFDNLSGLYGMLK